jgi:hypothetical protein
MTARDLFGVLVRFGGLTLIVFGFVDLVDAAVRVAGAPVPSRHSVAEVLVVAGIWLLSGIVVFLAAGALTRIAYGPLKEPN